MRRWSTALFGAASVIVALVATLGPATSAGAAVAGPADIEAGAEPATGAVGATIEVRLHLINHGPGNVATGWMMLDYQAPAGTELVGTRSSPGAHLYPMPSICSWPAPKTHARCILQGNLFYQQGDHGDADYGVFLDLRVVATVTAPGRFGAQCYDPACSDPKPGNNSAKIIVNGVSATVKPKPSSSPSLSPSTAPSASASVSAPSSESSITPAADPAGTPALNPAAHTSGSGALIAVLTAIVALTMVGGLGFLGYRRVRRAPSGPDSQPH